MENYERLRPLYLGKDTLNLLEFFGNTRFLFFEIHDEHFQICVEHLLEYMMSIYSNMCGTLFQISV